MDEILRDAIVSLGAFAAIFGMVYVFFVTRHRERMSILEKGLESSPFNSNDITNRKSLKYGMLAIGIALGLLTGNILHKGFGFEKSVAFLSMIFLLGGASLIGNYLIEKKNSTKL